MLARSRPAWALVLRERLGAGSPPFSAFGCEADTRVQETVTLYCNFISLFCFVFRRAAQNVSVYNLNIKNSAGINA